MTRPLIALLTDFGLADPYVGMMKGVVAGICPEAHVVDITHEVPPQDIRTGAFFLDQASRYFPEGAILVAVVDPGVGSARAPLALSTGTQMFVGPDNGILSWLKPRQRVVTIRRKAYVRATISQTFHGRDVFAPAAAHLARGVALDRLGPRAKDIVELAWPAPRAAKRGLVAEIVSIDHFGNLVTSIEPSHWASLRRPRLVAGKFSCTELASSYQAAPRGALLVIFGSYGLLEIAVHGGSAAERLGLCTGGAVRLEAQD